MTHSAAPPVYARTIPLREFERPYRIRANSYEKDGIPFIAYLHTQGWCVVRTDKVEYKIYLPDDEKYITRTEHFRKLAELRKQIEKLNKAGRLVESIESDGVYVAKERLMYERDAIE